MHRITIFIITTIFCFSANPINPPQKVTTFYGGFKQLEQAATLNQANAIQQQMASCFMAYENSGIQLHLDGLDEMPSNLYTIKLFSMIYKDKSLKADCNITKTEIAEQPDQTKSMQRKSATHYMSYVTKTYTRDGKTKTLNDVVFTLISNGLITEMVNTDDIGATVTSTPVQLSIEQLRNRAAYCYSKGMHEQAYDYYEQLINRAPKDGDAYYRIALLTFWRKGCKKKFSRRGAQRKAKEYIDQAILYGNTEIQEKATNVKNNWNNRNVYF